MQDIRTKSTSLSSAQANDVVLRATEGVRLVFRPTIIDNRSNPDAAVRGTFLYQRKRRSAEWEDFETIPLSSVKCGEGYKLDLKSEELLDLIQHVQALGGLKQLYGVPRGQKHYVQVTPQLEQLSQLDQRTVQHLLNANVPLGNRLLSKLIKWAASLDASSELIDHLLKLDPKTLQQLNAAIGLGRIRAALAAWESDRNNSSEDVWQKHLTTHSFVLEHIFSWPAAIVQGKAYVGGKTVQNKHGNIVDFLLRNRLTQSAALVEIKTPVTRLLGSPYRQTYNAGQDLSGSIMQVLNYKHSLQENFRAITSGGNDLFDAFDPPCAVIIGDTAQLDSVDKTKAFELYRRQFPGVTVITFNELFDRTRSLIDLLEGNDSVGIVEVDDDIPF